MTRRLFVTAAAVTVTAALVAGTAPALAASGPSGPLAPRTTFQVSIDAATGSVAVPRSGELIPNVDSVKSTIRRYYAASGGIANKVSSPYIAEVGRITAALDRAYPALTAGDHSKAIVFDADDTLLWNYDFEDKATQFNFDPAVNAGWVTGTDPTCQKFNGFCFPAVPGMPALVRTLAQRGYQLYLITGRPESQKQATIANLAAAGFTVDVDDPIFTADDVFSKWNTSASSYDPAQVPAYIKNGQCTTFVDAAKTQFKCTTVEYKAQTRRQIETADHVEIVGNVGDQLSDLWGGYANRAWKIPNPTYFLASPNLDKAHAGSDDQAKQLQPARTYVMRADGSSGVRVAGDKIPNIDPVRTEIRAYYNATNGIADKASSPYIREMTALTTRWKSKVATDCRTQAAKAAQGAAKAHRQARLAVKKALKAWRKAVRRHHGVARAKARLASARWAARHINVKRPAVVFDADDTTLWTYDMEDGAMKFVYTPAAASEWVLGQKFPATPRMIAVVRAAKKAGCTVFGLTGRPTTQQGATIANLTKAGYVDQHGASLFTSSRYFTKPAGAGATVQYKSGVRRHIERDLKYRIVGNFGDQYSDLRGGYAKATYKLPNPTYYLP